MSERNRSQGKPRTWSKSRGNRLPADCYLPRRPVHVTICAFQHAEVFRDHRIADPIFQCLAARCDTLAACLMPDHLHWLLKDSQGLVDTVGKFKSYTTTLARRRSGCRRIWQRSFWDHVIRSDENLQQVAQYIVANPIEAGLTETVDEYPYQIVRNDISSC